ncbi:MAG: SH3 domain-containing protein [Lachnospiraceae bacterium]|nr:SH3 domain-containing protein [Lachnospiraceae bacterium]
MKNFRTGREKFGVFRGFAACALAAGIFWMTAVTALAAEGEITAATAKIRAQASTDSEVVGSTVKGKKVDLIESVKDGAGMTWYKVPVAGGGYGYIRGDLVSTSDTVPEGTAAQAAQPAAPASQPAETVPTAIGEQAAVIQCETNAKIRSGASTSHSVVTSLPNGTAITLIGEASDSAGNKWYQLTCNYNNKTIEGYVRSDLIAIGAQAGGDSSEGEGGEAPAEGENPEGGEGENPEGGEQNPEEGEPEPVQDDSHNDYEVRWSQNQDNEDYDYFLYDNTTGTRMRLSEVLNAATSSSEYTQKLQSQVDKNKIIIIVLAAVIILLFVIITIMIFKIRSLYYDDYDDEEEEEEEEPEPVPVKKKVRRRVEEEEEEPVPVKKKKPVPKEGTSGKNPERQARPRREAEPEVRAAERREGTKKPAARKSQNFLVDDDEFEFEFLNMDDKDL